ncbi:MAG: hypothetical protein AAF518_07925 [Spirochaetota bacterium]
MLSKKDDYRRYKLEQNYKRYKEELDELAPYLGFVYLCFSIGVLIIFFLTSDNPLLQLLFAMISLGLAGLIFVNKSQALKDINDYITVSFSLIIVVILFVKRKDTNPYVFYSELVALVVILTTSIIYRFLIHKTFDMFYRIQYRQEMAELKAHRMIDHLFPYCIESEQIIVLHLDIGNLFEYYRDALASESIEEEKLKGLINQTLAFLDSIEYDRKINLEKRGYRYFYYLRNIDKTYHPSLSGVLIESALEIMQNLQKLNSREKTDFGFNIGIVRDDYVISQMKDFEICFRFKEEVFERVEQVRTDGGQKSICVDENIFMEHHSNYNFTKKSIEITTGKEIDKRNVYVLQQKSLGRGKKK